MPKRLAILVISALCAIAMAGQPNKTDGNKEVPSDRDNPSAATTYTYNSGCCTTQASKKSQEEPYRWYTPFERPDWWTVLIALFTGIVICWQSRETRRAANASKIAAEASLKQADHMAESGRAWILEEINFPLDRVPYQPTEAGSSLMTTVVGVRLRNHGSGIAHIKSVRLRFHSVLEIGDRRMPSNPDYSTLVNPPELGRDGFALPPRQGFCLSVKLETRCLSKVDAEAVERNEMGLWVYGRVDYKTFGESRFTQFCYLWRHPQGLIVQGVDIAGFRKGGPDAYNAYE